MDLLHTVMIKLGHGILFVVLMYIGDSMDGEMTFTLKQWMGIGAAIVWLVEPSKDK